MSNFAVMNNNSTYLPQYTLCQLADCVAMKLAYFVNIYNADNIWSAFILEKCKTIEAEPRNVNTIIVEFKKSSEIIGHVSTLAVYKYHAILTRIYIILYYRHRDDRVFQTVVFPRLIKNMGYYGKDDSRIFINNEIKRMIEEDKLVEESQSTVQTRRTDDIAENNRAASDGKRIVLAKNRNSDFTRIVQAMVTDGYFQHADKSDVTATEVGKMMLELFSVNTEWKSMLQKAYSRDNPLKTFDRLRDAAQKYWSDRCHLND